MSWRNDFFRKVIGTYTPGERAHHGVDVALERFREPVSGADENPLDIIAEMFNPRMGRGLGPACSRVFDSENKLTRMVGCLMQYWTSKFTQAVVQASPPVVACRWGLVVHVGLAVGNLGRPGVAPWPERLYRHHSETVAIKMNGKNWFRPLYAGLEKADNL